MSYEHLRRSSRIPKELAILLTGSDMDGKGFSEMTKTVLLSRHGAGVVSTYKLSAEQEIIVRYLDTNKEAVVRVVGRIGSEGEIYTYGVAFVDTSNIDFWGIDFAPVSEQEKIARRVLLECATCQLRETVEHLDVESDVLMINEGIVRYCKECHDSTLWKRASGIPAETPSEIPQEQPVLAAVGRDAGLSSFSGATSAIIAPPSASISSSLSDQLLDGAELISASASPSTSAPSPLLNPASKPDNRRKHPRTKVSYKACIRRSGFLDDVVTCEDMSKGGLCFKSRKQYFPRTDIEVAVPYSPGGNAIFVPAQVAWVVEITKDKQYKCGVAYRRASKAS
ncbi:MAG TPA: PilZ domain-containing protein [Candidatus Solibacter sp.]|nr:PilZ domain-containing protein [Candidatus Solibacter sp.]